MGEIGIAGVGLADGYLNRPDLTAQKFIPDFLGIADNPSGRIYRTGDVGRINDDGEVEFHGRIDTQVKIRGYRIELAEIEAAIAELEPVAQAVVHPYEPEPGTLELVAYYTLKAGAGELALSEAAQTLKARLPAYMIPAYFEKLAAIPMTGSNKLDRKALPAPKGPRFAAGGADFVAPRSEREERLARALQEVMRLERVSVTDNFFHDLGGHSLLMARFCSALRREGADVAIKDIYLNPTIETLARASGAGRGRRAGRGGARAGARSLGARLLGLRSVAGGLLPRLRRCRAVAAGGRLPLVVCAHRRPAGDIRPRRRLRRRAVRADDGRPHRRQVAADRTLAAAGHSGLEPRLLPLLAGEDADPLGAARGVRRLAALQFLSAPPRRQDRSGQRSRAAGTCRSRPTC